MHYTPNGRQAEDLTKVGVWFGDEENITHEVSTRVALNHNFEIPPGAKNHLVEIEIDGFYRNSHLLSITPHMHLRGKSFRLVARRTSASETLLHVPHYDFNWQHLYRFESPIPLDRVAALEMQVCFDNSGENPANPDPEEFVTWGDQTWQEMAVAFFDIAHPRDQPRVWENHEDQDAADTEAERQAQISKAADKFLAALDQNGDGVIVREEVPDAFRMFGFRQVDHNRDNRLERSEIEAEAANRL
jgi:hypothetical protein